LTVRVIRVIKTNADHFRSSLMKGRHQTGPTGPFRAINRSGPFNYSSITLLELVPLIAGKRWDADGWWRAVDPYRASSAATEGL
jgi:hypothetical protein